MNPTITTLHELQRREDAQQADWRPLNQRTQQRITVSAQRKQLIDGLRRYLRRESARPTLGRHTFTKLHLCQALHDRLLSDTHIPVEVLARNFSAEHADALRTVKTRPWSQFSRLLSQTRRTREGRHPRRLKVVHLHGSYDRALIHYLDYRQAHRPAPQASLFDKHQLCAANLEVYKNGYGDSEHMTGAFADICRNFQAQIDRANSGQSAHILLAGWSIGLQEPLQYRDSDGNVVAKTLKEWIVDAAQAGVQIHLLSWYNTFVEDDATRNTHDLSLLRSELRQGNEPWKRNIFIKFSTRDSLFSLSDHQKLQIFPEQGSAFVGGLDLMQGRSDDYTHDPSLDRPDQGHYNWSDAHLQIRGEAVVNLVELFRMRWHKKNRQPHVGAADDSRLRSQSALEGAWQAAYRAARHCAAAHGDDDSRATVQVITSMTSDSVGKKGRGHFFCDKLKRHPLNPLRKVLVSREIMSHYVDAISRAENYIYMENQYFSGPHHNKQYRKNKVIKALIDKIVEQHHSYEREMLKPASQRDAAKASPFIFECTLPYRPAGEPHDSLGVKLALIQQWQTMQYLIQEINKRTGNQAGRYVRFVNPMHAVDAADGSQQAKMIYVHSKLLIVDGQRMIVGSANNNMRSMKGNHDTEVALDIQSNGDPQVTAKILQMQRLAQRELYGDLIGELSDEELLDYRNDALQSQINAHLDSKLCGAGAVDLAKVDLQQGFATPWGNIPRARLMQGKRRRHINYRKRSELWQHLKTALRACRELPFPGKVKWLRNAPSHIPRHMPLFVAHCLRFCRLLRLPLGEVAT